MALDLLTIAESLAPRLSFLRILQISRDGSVPRTGDTC